MSYFCSYLDSVPEPSSAPSDLIAVASEKPPIGPRFPVWRLFLFFKPTLPEMSEEGYNKDNKYLVCLIARSGTGRALRQLKFLKLSTQASKSRES